GVWCGGGRDRVRHRPRLAGADRPRRGRACLQRPRPCRVQAVRVRGAAPRPALPRPAGPARLVVDGAAAGTARQPRTRGRRDLGGPGHPAAPADRRDAAGAAARRRPGAHRVTGRTPERGAVMSIELERAVSSIRVGNRHRTDLGDIDALAASIARDGLLQPPTITPDGVLVCGRRRLAAIQQLGWRVVNVWVRQGISDRLGHLLAEQDDNLNRIVDLMRDLRATEARRHVRGETPFYTGPRMPLAEIARRLP